MDAATVAQMMHKMNPQMLAHLGGQAGLEQMMTEMEKEEKKLKKKKNRQKKRESFKKNSRFE